MNLVPYSFSSDRLPDQTLSPLGSGQFQAVHMSLDQEHLDWFLSKIEQWFEERDEVILVASGTSVQGQAFILLEWEECQIDPLFLKILENEEAVSDVCVYIREEVE